MAAFFWGSSVRLWAAQPRLFVVLFSHPGFNWRLKTMKSDAAVHWLRRCYRRTHVATFGVVTWIVFTGDLFQAFLLGMRTPMGSRAHEFRFYIDAFTDENVSLHDARLILLGSNCQVDNYN
jgi:hypothetical protein